MSRSICFLYCSLRLNDIHIVLCFIVARMVSVKALLVRVWKCFAPTYMLAYFGVYSYNSNTVASTVEPLYNGDHWEPKFVLYSGVSQTKGLLVSKGSVTCGHCILGLSELLVLYTDRVCYTEASATSDSANLMSSC